MLLTRRNRNLTSSKVCAHPAALMLALTCVPGFTIHAGSLTKGDPFNQAFMQKVSQTPPRTTQAGQRTTKVQWKDDHGSGTLSAKDFALTADSKDINAIAKDGHLAIDETRDGIRRKLRIEPTREGTLKRTYSVNGVAKEMDEEGKAWLAGIIHNFLNSQH
jgi:hypothetical protein